MLFGDREENHVSLDCGCSSELGEVEIVSESES